MQRKLKPHASCHDIQVSQRRGRWDVENHPWNTKKLPQQSDKIVAKCRSPDSDFKPLIPILASGFGGFSFFLYFVFGFFLWFVRRQPLGFVALARVWLIKAQTLGIFNLYACKMKFIFFYLRFCFSFLASCSLFPFELWSWCVLLFLGEKLAGNEQVGHKE